MGQGRGGRGQPRRDGGKELRAGRFGRVLDEDVRQVERERAAFAGGRLDMDLAAEQARDLAADRQAEPRAAIAAARRPVRLLERLEDHAQLVRGDPDARVHDREPDHVGGVREGLAGELATRRRLGDPEDDSARLGELERVREQVLQDLLEPLLVGVDRRQRALGEVELERQPLLGGHRHERPLETGELLGHRHLGGVHVHLPGLDLGEIEDVVDQAEQLGACIVDRVRKLDLLGGQVPVDVVAEQLRQDQQRVERRPQLVRHVREELGLVLRGERELLRLLLQRAAGLLDLGVLDLDPGVLLLELLRALLELLVRLLQLLLLRLQQLFGGAERRSLRLELCVRPPQLVLLRLQLLRLALEILRQRLRLEEQLLGAHVRVDRVQHDADRLGEHLEEGLLDLGERRERRELDHRHHRLLEEDGEDDDARRRGLAEAGGDRDVVAREPA